MAQQQQSASMDRMKKLRERIARWRSTVPKPRPMPAPLWEEAVALARELGGYRVKSALGLNYESLRKRLDEANSRDRGQPDTGADFVELSGAQLLATSALTGPVVEVSDAGGGRLTVRLGAGSTLDVARLVAVFRGQPA